MRPPYNKYGAKKCVVDGVAHDSQHEGRVARELRQLQAAGIIRNLRLDKKADKEYLRFPFVVNGEKLGYYECDARFELVQPYTLKTKTGYQLLEVGQDYVLDAKGVKTPVYRLKVKLLWALYKKKVLEV